MTPTQAQKRQQFIIRLQLDIDKADELRKNVAIEFNKTLLGEADGIYLLIGIYKTLWVGLHAQDIIAALPRASLEAIGTFYQNFINRWTPDYSRGATSLTCSLERLAALQEIQSVVQRQITSEKE